MFSLSSNFRELLYHRTREYLWKCRFLLKLVEFATIAIVLWIFFYIYARYVCFYDQEFLHQIFRWFTELSLIETLGANQTG